MYKPNSLELNEDWCLSFRLLPTSCHQLRSNWRNKVCGIPSWYPHTQHSNNWLTSSFHWLEWIYFGTFTIKTIHFSTPYRDIIYLSFTVNPSLPKEPRAVPIFRLRMTLFSPSTSTVTSWAWSAPWCSKWSLIQTVGIGEYKLYSLINHSDIDSGVEKMVTQMATPY